MKATSPGGSEAIKQIDIRQLGNCDAVQEATTNLEKDQLFYDISLGQTQLYADMTAQFTPQSDASCSITYELQTTSDNGATFTAYNDSGTVYKTDAGEVYVNVSTP